MSYKGQYLRGEKWFALYGKVVDKDKLVDVELYLKAVEEANKKPKEEKPAETKSKEKK